MHIADIFPEFSWTQLSMCKLLIRIKINCYTGNIIPDFFLCFQHRNIFTQNKLHCLIRSRTHTGFMKPNMIL